MEKLTTVPDIFGDGIASVEHWDFSKANMSEATRIEAITQVASICYQSPKAFKSEALYNRLLAESIGLPSSSFEFVPVLLSGPKLHQLVLESGKRRCDTVAYSAPVSRTGHILTNLRAVISDVGAEASKNYYNTEEECEIISKHFYTFLFHVDIPTRTQMIRHRISWQELSRRYVSGERVPFEFYVSEKMQDVTSQNSTVSTQNIIDLCVDHYRAAIESGVKPQEARRIIPQAAYTKLWGAFTDSYLNNFLTLRLDSHSQWEIQQVAKAMLFAKNHLRGNSDV